MSSSRLVVLISATSAISSMLSAGSTSSAKIIVAIPSASPIGRSATSCSLERITTRAIATLPVSAIASSSSRYGFAPPGPGAR